jgi:hypothetical protein
MNASALVVLSVLAVGAMMSIPSKFEASGATATKLVVVLFVGHILMVLACIAGIVVLGVSS